MNENISGSIKLSGVWGRVVAAWDLVSEYTEDYFSGYKWCSGHNLRQQKQK